MQVTMPFLVVHLLAEVAEAVEERLMRATPNRLTATKTTTEGVAWQCFLLRKTAM
jgi:hypothetical protein